MAWWWRGDISSLIIYLIQWHDYWHIVCVCVCVCRWKSWWCWVGTETLTSPRGQWTFLCVLSLSLCVHTQAWMQERWHVPSIPQNPCLQIAVLNTHTHTHMHILVHVRTRAHTHTHARTHAHTHTHTHTPLHPLALGLGAEDGRHGDWFLVKCQWRWKYCPKAPHSLSLLYMCVSHCLFHSLLWKPLFLFHLRFLFHCLSFFCRHGLLQLKISHLSRPGLHHIPCKENKVLMYIKY